MKRFYGNGQCSLQINNNNNTTIENYNNNIYPFPVQNAYYGNNNLNNFVFMDQNLMEKKSGNQQVFYSQHNNPAPLLFGNTMVPNLVQDDLTRKKVQMLFRNEKYLGNFCTNQLSAEVSKKPSIYQLIFRNLGIRNFHPEIDLVENGRSGGRVRNDLICVKDSFAIDSLHEYYNVKNDIVSEYGWGTKAIEFYFNGEEYSQSGFKINTYNNNNLIFQTQRFLVFPKETKNERKYWMRESGRSKQIVKYLREKKSKKEKKQNLLDFSAFPFSVFFENKYGHNRVITLFGESSGRFNEDKSDNEEEEEITGFKRKR